MTSPSIIYSNKTRFCCLDTRRTRLTVSISYRVFTSPRDPYSYVHTPPKLGPPTVTVTTIKVSLVSLYRCSSVFFLDDLKKFRPLEFFVLETVSSIELTEPGSLTGCLLFLLSSIKRDFLRPQ